MVSSKFLRTFGGAVSLASKLRLLPCSWDGQKKRIQVSRGEALRIFGLSLRIGRNDLFPLLYLLLQILHTTYIIIFWLFFKHSTIDNYICLFLFTTMSGMVFMTQLNYFFYFDEICSLTNTFLSLDEAFVAAGISNDSSGLVELLLNGLALVAVGYTIALFPTTLYLLLNDTTFIYKDILVVIEIILPGPPVIWLVLFSLFMSFLAMLCWIFIVLSVAMMIIYVKSQSTWLIKLKDLWEQNTNVEGGRLIINYSRGSSVMHAFCMDVFRFMLPSFVFTAELVIIASLFLAIRLRLSADEAMISVSVLAVGLICLCCFQFALAYAAKVMDSSLAFTRTPKFQDGRQYRKEDKCFLASCKPLPIRVGRIFIIQRNTFPKICQEIIVGILVNLLITF